MVMEDMADDKLTIELKVLPDSGAARVETPEHDRVNSATLSQEIYTGLRLIHDSCVYDVLDSVTCR